MKKFVFKAKDWKGKYVKGIVEAQTQKSAIELLKERGLVILSLQPQKKSIIASIKFLFLMKVSLGQLVAFTRQLATMITAGLPLTDALVLIEDQSKGKMAQITEEALAKVQGGSPLGRALEKDRKTFGDAYIASVKAGEEGGVLDKVLLRLADNLEKKKEFTGRVKGAMIYPIIIVVGMVLVTIIMMVFVVPKMTSMYDEFGSDIPASTKALMFIADLTSKNIWLLPFLIVGLVILFKVASKRPNMKRKIDEWKLRAPIIGPLIEAVSLTEVSRTLGTLLGTGVPLVDALKIVSEVSGNEVYRYGLEMASDRVEKGLPLSEAVSENPAFPPIVAQLIATGEQTGKLDEILGNVSRYFEMESDQRVKALTSAIEPLIMIVLGVGVAFLVIAIIMPIYNLSSQF